MQQSAERPTTLSQFLYTHRRLTDLARGPLPSEIVEEMTHTACGIAEKILEAPAADWRELSKKAVSDVRVPFVDPGLRVTGCDRFERRFHPDVGLHAVDFAGGDERSYARP
ncbi:hypothetical protein ACVIWV_009344 [Bradyrhizobium diazoefficiens]